MFTRSSSHIFAMGFLVLLFLILAACTPTVPVPQTGAEPTQPVITAAPAGVFAGLDAEEILIQLTYEPGFVLPEYRFPFGRTPYFTLLADGRAIYIDENQHFKVMQAQLSQAEAAALLQKVREMGFEHLQSHTDMCGKMADGSESCIADASTSVMRVRMENGSLREIRNYANFSNGPVTYEAIFNLLNEYTHPKAAIYVPHAATLFVRIVPPPEMSSPADWPLDPTYVKRAQAAPEQFTAMILSSEEAALWQKNVGINNGSITFQLDGQPVSGFFVPWLPGEDFSKEIAAEFPAQ
ncbi:MAG: hypothetical protein IH586_02260 [Anaerolineaceae bacterium]|nr:hypothetical protein [Anaerolineaceae bacterium]